MRYKSFVNDFPGSREYLLMRFHLLVLTSSILFYFLYRKYFFTKHAILSRKSLPFQ